MSFNPEIGRQNPYSLSDDFLKECEELGIDPSTLTEETARQALGELEVEKTTASITQDRAISKIDAANAEKVDAMRDKVFGEESERVIDRELDGAIDLDIAAQREVKEVAASLRPELLLLASRFGREAGFLKLKGMRRGMPVYKTVTLAYALKHPHKIHGVDHEGSILPITGQGRRDIGQATRAIIIGAHGEREVGVGEGLEAEEFDKVWDHFIKEHSSDRLSELEDKQRKEQHEHEEAREEAQAAQKHKAQMQQASKKGSGREKEFVAPEKTKGGAQLEHFLAESATENRVRQARSYDERLKRSKEKQKFFEKVQDERDIVKQEALNQDQVLEGKKKTITQTVHSRNVMSRQHISLVKNEIDVDFEEQLPDSSKNINEPNTP